MLAMCDTYVCSATPAHPSPTHPPPRTPTYGAKLSASELIQCEDLEFASVTAAEECFTFPQYWQELACFWRSTHTCLFNAVCGSNGFVSDCTDVKAHGKANLK